MTREEAITRLKQSQDYLKSAGVQHLYLFGPTARGDERSDSEIDLVFDHERGTISLLDPTCIKMAVDIPSTKVDMIPVAGFAVARDSRIEASAVQVFQWLRNRLANTAKIEFALASSIT